MISCNNRMQNPRMLQNDIDNFPIEQPIQLDESGLDEAIEILDNAQEHLNQNFEQLWLIKTMMTMTVRVVLKI